MESIKFITAAFVLVMLAGATPLLAAVETYKVDPPHSFLLFHVRHLNAGNVYGRFNAPTGTIKYDAENPANSTFEVEVPSANIDTGVEKRDQHLKSPDFFNVEQFPTLSFKSTKVEAGGSADTLKVTGDLTIHGVTKPVTVEVKKLGEGKNPQGAELIGFESRFTVKRSDYDMNFMAGGVGDEIHIVVALEAIKQ